MSEEMYPETSPNAVSIQLIDPNTGRPMQTWNFSQRNSVHIGRGDDCDVVLADPYVSRDHAELSLRSGQWVLIAHGRNGVLVRDQLVTEYPVERTVVFKLGKKGPSLRFEEESAAPVGTATLNFDSVENIVFELDGTRLEREVSEIADGDFFQSLKAKAKSLRNFHSKDL